MKNVLNYFVRKAFGFKSTATDKDKTLFGHLLRIRQNIQGVYDWLYPKLRGSADGTIPRRMPMTEAVVDPNGNMGAEPLRLRPVAQNTDTLLAHLRLLDGRKISNGYQDGTPADDGLPDGVSLARLLCDSTTKPTALVDDNVGWTLDNTLVTAATKVLLNCKTTHTTIIADNSTIAELELPSLEEATKNQMSYRFIKNCPNIKSLYFPSLKTYSLSNGSAMISNMANLEEVVMPNTTNIASYLNVALIHNCPKLRKLVIGTTGRSPYDSSTDSIFGNASYLANTMPDLLHFEIGEGFAYSLNLKQWSPTLDSSNLSLFLDNFLHFIAERVAEGNYTLTLSAAVFSSIWDADGNAAVIGDGHDELRAAINTELRYNKHWNVNKA